MRSEFERETLRTITAVPGTIVATRQEHTKDNEINDFSCYITIQNTSDSDLLLADFGVEKHYGVWPLYQPLNTIEARSTGRVHLKDPKGRSSLV